MAVDLLLFDLDDTLLRTADLEQDYRGIRFLNRQSQDYVDRLRASYNTRANRIVYPRAFLEGLRLIYPGVRIGVFTKSPRHYAEIILGLAYPALKWDALVAFEDVAHTKPSGEGILTAMARLRVGNPQHVWMVGDSKGDIQAAYDAGCWVILDKTTWPAARRKEDWWALERLPDAAIAAYSELLHVISAPHDYLPIAERLQHANCAPIAQPPARFEKWGSFDENGKNFPIHYLGRHFSREAQRRVHWHPVTNDIHAMKDMMTVPQYWIDAIRAFLKNLVQRNHMLAFGGSLVVTVIPAKPNRVRRLEAMLEQLSVSNAQTPISGARISFVPDLMRYSEGVLSQHGGEGLNKKQRLENVRDHLKVIMDSGYQGKHVVVIDDVATTGASLVYAQKYLTAAGAREVTCLSLTKAINTQ